MTVSRIDPIEDSRWKLFLENHSCASIFHTPAWLKALRRTYGYEPMVLTTSAPGEPLSDGLVVCQVKSWLTGHRFVSLPFSDHCQPLSNSVEKLDLLVSELRCSLETAKARYFEIRPITLPELSTTVGEKRSYCLHRLDLRPSLEDLFRGFHKSCIQRKIQAAQKASLDYEEGSSDRLLDGFYRLLVLTRRRQQAPPQPLAWFRNLIACMGGMLKIRMASKDGVPVASILTLRFKDSLVYKYGCSDTRFKFGGTQLLFWKAIQEARQAGLAWFDLGRSDWSNPGLITFKDRWGAERSTIEYHRFNASRGPSSVPGWQTQIAARLMRRVPEAFLPWAGSLIYRHYA